MHTARNDWHSSIYPVVPGHEIVGRITNVGESVTKFKVGDLAGVGCIVDSCRECDHCHEGNEQYCESGWTVVFNAIDKKHGGIAETQEVLNFCAEHNITADIELIGTNQVNDALERLEKGDVKYRFVIDLASLKN